MNRRSTPQHIVDDRAFPVRVRVFLAEGGLNPWETDGWLTREVGRGNYAQHSASMPGEGRHTTAFYFRDAETARAFVAAFPDLVLADGTELPGYTSPFLPSGRPQDERLPVCNLYSMLKSQEAMRRLFAGLIDRAGNMPPLPGIYPDYAAPIIRNAGDGRELVMARWGLPSPPSVLAGKSRDPGVTNVRNTTSSHWQRWLGPEHRCVVPFTSFAEPVRLANGRSEPVWFSRDETRPLMWFAGIWTRWRSVRKVKLGEETVDAYAILTCSPNAEVREVHPKAMPVILAEADLERWLTAPAAAALQLQRPLPDGSLRIVARGEPEDRLAEGRSAAPAPRARQRASLLVFRHQRGPLLEQSVELILLVGNR